jgi:hypothetical protein
MRFNYKKIAGVLASAAMLSSTIGFAAAASYPTPFVDGSAVVYGTNAASSDVAAAIDIYDQLRDRASGTSGTTASVSGEAKAVETSSQPLYFGDILYAVKNTFNDDQLPKILADGTVTNDDGTDRDYELKLDVPDTNVIFGVTADSLATPVVFADFNNNSISYTYKIVFPTSVNITKLTDEPIRLFGKDYVVSGKAGDLTDQKIVLFDKTTTIKVNDGESVTSEGHTFSVSAESATSATIIVDGTSQTVTEGFSGKIGGVELYVKNIHAPNIAGTERYVELYLNSNKLTLEEGATVTKSSDGIDGTIVYFTNSSGKVSEINITVTPFDTLDDLEYLKIGDSYQDPAFDAVKFEMSSVTPELMGSDRDVIKFKATSNDEVGIEFKNKAGKDYDMNVLITGPVRLAANYSAMQNGTQYIGTAGNVSGTYTYNATAIGQDLSSARDLITDTVVPIMENDYFITCNNEYTQIWQLKSVTNTSTTSEIKVQDQGAGSETQALSLTGNAPGSSATLTLGDASTLTVTMINNSAINFSSGTCDYLYTKRGAQIQLQHADSKVHDGGNAKNESAIVIVEETAYNGGSFTDIGSNTLGKNISVRFARQSADRSGKQMFVRGVQGTSATGETGADVGSENIDWWTGSLDNTNSDTHWVTKYGSFVTQIGGDDDIVTVYYPEDAASLGFYIGETSSEITPGDGGTGAGGQISIIKDSEASGVTDKHLIVIGGSCVNTVAAQLLGSSSPLCGADFTTATQVSSGGYIIKSYDSPYADGKTAMLVAGYEASDTVNAVKRAMVIDGVTTDVGSEEVFPVVA